MNDYGRSKSAFTVDLPVFSDYLKDLFLILWDYIHGEEPGAFTFTENLCVQSQSCDIGKPTLIIISGTKRPLSHGNLYKSVKQLFQLEKKTTLYFGLALWHISCSLWYLNDIGVKVVVLHNSSSKIDSQYF